MKFIHYFNLIYIVEGSIIKKTGALLIINGLNRYFDPNGEDYLGVDSGKTIKYISDKLILARTTNIPVFFINDHKYSSATSQKEFFDNSVLEQLTPLENEEIIFKEHPSAFFQSWLETKLKELGVTEVVVTGTHTNLAVFFTAVDAKRKGFRVIIDEKCILTDSQITQAMFIKEMKETHGIEVF
ncbi:MAG: isochorismatase family cysteine hydrolase [Bacillota bacterium]